MVVLKRKNNFWDSQFFTVILHNVSTLKHYCISLGKEHLQLQLKETFKHCLRDYKKVSTIVIRLLHFIFNTFSILNEFYCLHFTVLKKYSIFTEFENGFYFNTKLG